LIVRSILGVSDAVETSTQDVTQLSTGTKLLNKAFTALKTPAGMAATAIIAIGYAAYRAYTMYKENMIEMANKSSSAWKETTSTLEEYTTQYKKLKEQLESGELTEEEVLSTKKEILDIQIQITEQYGSQASGIDLINGKLETQLSLLQQISEEEASEIINKNRQSYNDASYEMNKERTYTIRSGYSDIYGGQIKSIVDEFDELTIENTGKEGQSIKFKGTATEADEVINAFMNRLKEEFKDIDLNGTVVDGLLNSASEALSKNQEKVLDKYQDNYKNFLQMDMLSQEDESIEDAFYKYTEAVENFNEAVESGDAEAISEARKEVAELESNWDTLLTGDNKKYATLVVDVRSQLDTDGLKLFDFQELANGTVSDGNQFIKNADFAKMYMDGLKSLGVYSADAMNAFMVEGLQTGETLLRELAKIWGLTADSSITEIQEFIDVLEQLGIVVSSISGSSIDLPNITTETENFETLNTAITESVSATGLTEESITNLTKRYEDLEDFNAEELFEKTANGIHLNTDELNKLEKAYKKTKRQKFDNELQRLNEEYEELSDEIEINKDNQEKLQELYAKRESIANRIVDVAELASKYEGLTSAYQEWQKAQSDGDERDIYGNIATSRDEIEEELKDGWLDDGTKKYIELLSSDENLETFNDYANAWKKLKKDIGDSGYSVFDFFTVDDDGNATSEGIYNFLDTVNSEIGEQFAWKDKDGYHFDFSGFEHEGLTGDEAIAKYLGMDVEAVQSILRAAIDAGFTVDLESKYAAYDNFIDYAKSANDTLKDAGVTDYTFNFEATDIEYVNEQIDEAHNVLANLTDEEGKINLDTDEAQAAASIMLQLLIRKNELANSTLLKIDLSTPVNQFEEMLALASQIVELDAHKQLYLTLGDTESAAAMQKEINTVVNQLNTNYGDQLEAIGITAEIKPNTYNNFLTTIQALSDEALIQFGVAESHIAGYVPPDKEVKFTPDSKEVDAYLEDLKDPTRTVTFKKISEEVDEWIDSLDNKTVTFKLKYDESNTSDSEGGGVSVNGTAHADGTIPKLHARALAMGTLSFRPGTPNHAYAQGTWGTKRSETALVGELGRETVVYGNRYWTVGDNGAEFAHIPKGAIVFNHKQTEELFKNGHVTSDGGRAHVVGTAHVQGTAYYGSSGDGNDRNDSSNLADGSSGSSSNGDASDAAEDLKDWIEILISRIERLISNLDKTVSATYKTWTDRNAALKEELGLVNEELVIQQKAAERYLQEAESVDLSEHYKELVRNGEIDIEDISDEKLSENIQKYQEWYEKHLDCLDAAQDLEADLASLAMQGFDNVVSEYEDKLSVIEHEADMLDGYIGQIEERGYFVSTKYYEELISTERENISTLESEYAALQSALSKAMADGDIKMYSQDWYEMMSQIQDVEKSIQDANTSLVEYNNNMRELNWEIFEKSQEYISEIQEESDFLRELMSDEKMVDDKGSFTEYGQATLGLHAVDYNTYMSQADDYGKKIAEIDKELAKDPYNQTLIDKKNEYIDAQRDSIKAANDEKQSMLDLVKEGYDAMLNHMNETIDKRKELLQTTKDLYDYEKNVSEQTEEIARLQKILNAYEGDNSEEAKASIQQYKVQLEEAEQALEETEYDRYIQDQEKMLDDMYSDMEEWVSNRLEQTELIIQGVIDETNTSAGEIKKTLEEETKAVGTTLSEEMEKIWSTNGTYTTVVSTYYDEFGTQLTTTNSVLESIRVLVDEMVKNSDDIAKEDLGLYDGIEQSSGKIAGAVGNVGSTVNNFSNDSSNSPTASDENSSNNSNDGWGSWFISKKSNYSKSKLDKNVSIEDRLKYFDYDSSMTARKKYYEAMGGTGTYKGTASQNRWMISEMKAHGFAKGGTIGSLISGTGEDGFVLARTGEEILSLEKIQALKDAFVAIRPIAEGFKYISPASIMRDTNNISGHIEMNITLPGVTNYEEFKMALIHDKSFEKTVQHMTLGAMTGKNSLGKYKYN